MAQTARLFWYGRSQAVRLPEEFRMAGDEVRIRKSGSAVILEPIAMDWGWLDDVAGNFSDDFSPPAATSPRCRPGHGPSVEGLLSLAYRSSAA